MILEQLKEIRDKIEENVTAQLKLTIEGEEYIRVFRPQERMIILGCGHVSQPLCTIGAMLGFSVCMIDDRPSFANSIRFPQASKVICDDFEKALDSIGPNAGDYIVVMTRGHRYDAICLKKILSMTDPYYLGMLGSKRRTRALLNELEEEGYERDRLDRIHTPIGLEINALTIQEIAVSISAELVQCRRKNLKSKSKNNIFVEELFDAKVLDAMLDNSHARALMMVYDTLGSTPVKSGSLMVVNDRMETWGTIGGGCAEAAILREAYQMIGSGERKTMSVDMTNDVAGEEGMVCGGTLSAIIIDLTKETGSDEEIKR